MSTETDRRLFGCRPAWRDVIDGMLQLLWNRLAYLGVLQLKDESEQKYVVLANSLALIIAGFAALITAAFFVLVPSAEPAQYVAPLLFSALLPGTAWLNGRGHFYGARCYFSALTCAFLAYGSFSSGGPSNFHYYLIVAIMVMFFIFPARERRTMHAFVAAQTAFFIGFHSVMANYTGFSSIQAETLARARVINGVSVILMSLSFAYYASSTFQTAERYLHAEKDKSERLLLNILPAAIVQKLRESPDTIAERFENCTVLFSDIVGFTELSRTLPAVEVVGLLNEIFSAFDDLSEKHGLEKIKTIGDAYMVVGGLPAPDALHAERVAGFALDMLEVVREHRRRNDYGIELRVGIASGDAVAGVIGKKKFVYDLWGDSVNTASRMESHGLPGRVQVTESTHALIKHKFAMEERGAIEVKGMGMVRSYLLLGAV